jgi:tRNA-Thr(GGU) m(6)t(6)A37 methyltransferase TsaA
MSFKFKQIGTIKTPYVDSAPYQPVEKDEGDFRIVLDRKYTKGLFALDSFRYVYVIYYIDRLRRSPSMIVSPSWAPGTKVGLFASRSPLRPNPIGISIVRVKKIANNEIFTSGLDVFDNTPLLDVKPYLKDLDSKDDANYGWVSNLKSNEEHLVLHIKGIPHEY